MRIALASSGTKATLAPGTGVPDASLTSTSTNVSAGTCRSRTSRAPGASSKGSETASEWLMRAATSRTRSGASAHGSETTKRPSRPLRGASGSKPRWTGDSCAGSSATAAPATAAPAASRSLP